MVKISKMLVNNGNTVKRLFKVCKYDKMFWDKIKLYAYTGNFVTEES